MDSHRRQRSISLCQPHFTSPHPSRAGVPTGLPDALGYRPSTAGGQGATLSTFPLVPLTREPTCTQAIDPGISRSTLTPADTSRPSRSSGHFPHFPWPGSPWLAHGSPLHGDWFPNFMGLLLGAFGLPALPMSHSPLPHPGTGPFPASPGLPTLSGRCVALATRPSPPRPLVPASRVYAPPGRLLPCGAGPLGPLPSRDRFVPLARVAPFPPPSLSPVPRPWPNPPGCLAAPSHPSSRVYTPPGRQQPRRGPTGSSSIRGPFRAPSTGRSPPSPAPLSCAVSLAVLVTWGRRVALATRPFLSRLLVVLRGVLRVCFPPPFFFCFFFPLRSLLPACTHNNTASPSRFCSVLTSSPSAILWRCPWRSPAMPKDPAIQPALLYMHLLSPLSTLPSPLSPARPLSVVPLLRVLAAGRLRVKAVSRAPSRASGPPPCLPTCRPTWAASPDTPSGGLPRPPLPPAAPPSVP